MKAWLNGNIVDTPIQIDSFNWSIHYGSAVWEGIRSYVNKNNKNTIFLLDDHITRLFNSAKLLQVPMPFDKLTLMNACLDVLVANGGGEQYIRPVVYYSGKAEGAKTSLPDVNVEVHSFLLPSNRDRKGIKALTSPKSRSYPDYWTQCKSVNNYGFFRPLEHLSNETNTDTVFLTDRNGYYTEALTANIFTVKIDKTGITLFTPPSDGNILPGLTREFIMGCVSKRSGYKIVERKLTAPDIIIADGVFICGTYAEVTPVIELDGYILGTDTGHKVVSSIAEEFHRYARS